MTDETASRSEMGPCSCFDSGKCRYVNGGPACMNEEQAKPSAISYRLEPVEPAPTYIESSGRWQWPLPERARFPGCCTEVVTASREWWEYAPSEAKPHPMAEGVMLRDKWYWAIPSSIEAPKHGDLSCDDMETLRRAINESGDCLSNCDSYAHEENCPNVNTVARMIGMQKEIEALRRNSSTVEPTFEQVRDAIIGRMSGHTISLQDAAAWGNFMGLLAQVKASECGLSSASVAREGKP